MNGSIGKASLKVALDMPLRVSQEDGHTLRCRYLQCIQTARLFRKKAVPIGPLKIQAALRAKGVSDNLIAAELVTADGETLVARFSARGGITTNVTAEYSKTADQ